MIDLQTCEHNIWAFRISGDRRWDWIEKKTGGVFPGGGAPAGEGKGADEALEA